MIKFLRGITQYVVRCFDKPMLRSTCGSVYLKHVLDAMTS